MALTKEQIENLLGMIEVTREGELNCEECLVVVAEFAETELRDKLAPAALDAVQHHLKLCLECREEYEVLLKVLHGIENDEG
jgi:uncharacterized protein with PIN domain